MPAFSRLWRRAPLWRWSIYTGTFFLVLAALYPTPRLLHQFPWLNRIPGSDAPRNASAPQAGASAGAQPQSNTASGNKGPLGPDRVGEPDINTTFSGGIPFGGHTLPLPAGMWHPVLTGQIGPGGAILFTILARTDRGVVTGVVIARVSSRPQPGKSADGVENSCHDDRNFASHILSEGHNGLLECWSVARSVGSSSDLVNAAFQRLHTLGFPIPSLFVANTWVRAKELPDHGGVDLAAVDTLIAPVKPGSIQLIAPLQYWDNSQLSEAPDANRFVQQTTRWMTHWVGVLRSGLVDGLPGNSAPADAARDPAAPPF